MRRNYTYPTHTTPITLRIKLLAVYVGSCMRTYNAYCLLHFVPFTYEDLQLFADLLPPNARSRNAIMQLSKLCVTTCVQFFQLLFPV